MGLLGFGLRAGPAWRAPRLFLLSNCSFSVAAYIPNVEAIFVPGADHTNIETKAVPDPYRWLSGGCDKVAELSGGRAG